MEGVIVRTPVQVFICGPNNAVNMRPAASGKRGSWQLAVQGQEETEADVEFAVVLLFFLLLAVLSARK